MNVPYTYGGVPVVEVSALTMEGEFEGDFLLSSVDHPRARTWHSNLYSAQNWALNSNYFNSGLAINFLLTPVTYYLVGRRDTDSAILNIYRAAMYLPWCLKLFFGVMSDTWSISGSRRRPYFLMGWVLFIVANVSVWLVGDPGVPLICILSSASSLGLVVAEAAADAMIVEATGYENKNDKGRMRVQGYFSRAIGMAIGAGLGASLYNEPVWGWGLSIGQCFLVQALIPLCTLIPFIPNMFEVEYRGDPETSASDLLSTCWDFMSIDAVWIPCLYVYFYNLCYVPNPVWFNFLFSGLGFSNFEVGMLLCAGALIGAIGVILFDYFVFDNRWKSLYLWTTLVGVFFSVLQLCLCYSFTFGLPEVLFAIGDQSILVATQLMTFLPMAIMFLPMIPNGAEATVYSLLTTWTNVASEIGLDLGTTIGCASPVLTKSLIAGEFEGVVKLTWITSALQVLPLFFIFISFHNVDCLPNGRREMRAQFDRNNKSWWGAFGMAVLYVTSILASVFAAVYIVFFPDAC